MTSWVFASEAGDPTPTPTASNARIVSAGERTPVPHSEDDMTKLMSQITNSESHAPTRNGEFTAHHNTFFGGEKQNDVV